MPLAVVAVFMVVAVVSILADQRVIALWGLGSAVAPVIGPKASVQVLQTIASGVVTVTSITFSMLLVAVQQTASNLSPVVFDQFIRRKGNQLLLGFFVGLSLFAYVVMATAQNKTPPIIGAFVATLMTVIALLLLVVLIYTAVNQMRPTSVLRQIHDRALRARGREAELIRRTRREEQQSHNPVLATYSADTNGYVVKISLRALAQALDKVPRAEIRLFVTLGDYVAYGDKIATVRDDDERDARSLERALRAAVVIGRQRNLEEDATTAVDELGNIAWSSASSARHSPEVARQGLHELRDLADRWLRDDQDPASSPALASDAMAVVYPDNDLERVLDVIYSLLAVAGESNQYMTAARVLGAYDALLPIANPRFRQRIERDLAMAESLLENLPPSPMLNEARRRIASRDRCSE